MSLCCNVEALSIREMCKTSKVVSDFYTWGSCSYRVTAQILNCNRRPLKPLHTIYRGAGAAFTCGPHVLLPCSCSNSSIASWEREPKLSRLL